MASVRTRGRLKQAVAQGARGTRAALSAAPRIKDQSLRWEFTARPNRESPRDPDVSVYRFYARVCVKNLNISTRF